MRPPKQAEVESLGRDELVQGILDRLVRTYATTESPGTLPRLADFFRSLDEPTLRAIAYQTGAFEPDLEPEPGEREERTPPEAG